MAGKGGPGVTQPQAPGFGLGPSLAKAVAGVQTGQMQGKRKKKNAGTLMAPSTMTKALNPPNGGSY
jgi:hypothetical protein